MTLTPGTRLGPYEIRSARDLSGLGEVYDARDHEQQRNIALRVLRADFAANPDRVRRFEQEARAAALLAHPNILTVHDIGTGAQAAYIVSEPIEGATLRDSLDRGALPLTTVIAYATHIAHALAAAHDKGVIHRDLKPENILVTPDGGVKVLGFGLAAVTQDESALDRGVPLGPPGYLSPEQVRGATVDHRSDMFAFGAILYEMLTGTRAFSGDTPIDTMTAVLKSDPPPPSAPDIPPVLSRIVERSLKKNAGLRLSAEDVVIGLQYLSAQPVPAGAVDVPRTPINVRRIARIAAVLGAIALAVAAGPWLLRVVGRAWRAMVPTPTSTSPAPPGPVTSLSAPTRPVRHFALSPDGRLLAFTTAGENGQPRLWVRSLTASTEQPLADTEGASFPFWSPDSRYIAFIAQGALKKIEASGGAAVTLAESTGNSPGAWSRDDVIVFPRGGANGPLHRVAAGGDGSSPVTTVMTGEAAHGWPVLLPDGRRFLFSVVPAGSGPPRIYGGSLESMTRAPLRSNAPHVVAYADGYLFFLAGNALMAQRLDAGGLQGVGNPVQVAVPAAPGSTGQVIRAFSTSDSGVLAYQTTPADPEHSQLAWFNREGAEVGRVGEPADYGDVRLSPDSSRAAVSVRDAGSDAADIWIVDIAQGVRSRVTSDPADDIAPVWAPDGRRIAFASIRKGSHDIYQRATSGPGSDTVVVEAQGDQIAYDWSSDGRYLLYQTDQPGVVTGGNFDLWARPFSGGRRFAFLSTVHAASRAMFSPDGLWVAYTSVEGGREDVYVLPFPRLGDRRRISARGGSWSRWSRDGSEMFYLDPDNRMMVVDVKAGSSGLDAGAARALFQVRAKPNRGYPYDVSADGQRFLVNVAGDAVASGPIALADWRSLVSNNLARPVRR